MDIITDYSLRKARAYQMSEYINTLREPKRNIQTEKVYTNLKRCASYLVFHDYISIDEMRLVKTQTCKQHLLCPFCAMRRAGKFIAKNVSKLEAIISENPTKVPALVTFTVKNGPALAERFNHLRNAHRRLNRQRLDCINKAQKFTEWSKVAGGITSYEFTKKGEGEWHPHIHALVMLDGFIDQKALSEEWHDLTGDSFIVDIRRIKNKASSGGLDIASGLLEVCKYALKFHDMTLPDTWHAFQTLRTRRLVDSFGILRGVKNPENLLDDPLADLPYVERHYKYRHYKRAYELIKLMDHMAAPA